MKKVLAFVVWFALCSAASAQIHSGNAPFTPITFDTVSNGLGGIRVLGPTPSQQVGQRIFNTAIATVNSDGSVNLKNNGTSLNTIPRIPVDVTSKVTKAVAAKSIASAAMRVLPGVATAAALLDLAAEINVAINAPAGGATTYHDNDRARFCDTSYPTSAQRVSAGETCRANYGYMSPGPTVTYTAPLSGNAGACSISYSCGGQGVFQLGSTPFVVVAGLGAALTQQQLEDKIAQKSGWPSSSKLGDALKEAARSGETFDAEPTAVTGPASAPTSTSQTRNADGSTTTTNTTNNYTYNGPNVNITNVTVTTTTNEAGSVTSVVSGSSTVAVPTQPSTPRETEPIITCGLPGTPPCKIDETSTKPEVAGDVYSKQLDALEAKNAADLATAAGTQDKSFFTGWGDLFKVPALVACEGFVLPNTMGTINPCGVVDGVRSMMAYIWALLAFYWCLGMVREVL